jgi:hypothetical protein
MGDIESVGATTVDTTETGAANTPTPASQNLSSTPSALDLENSIGDITEQVLANDNEEERDLSNSSTPAPVSSPNPTIRLVSYSIIKELDGFPRCPDDSALITEFSKIDWKDSFIVFISHCWLRGGEDCEEWDGFPHPDNRDNEKFQICLDAIYRLWQSLAPSMEDCYVWFDFASLNQNAANPGLELKHLDNIMEVCDCVLTPVVDQKWDKWSLHLRGNLFKDYRAVSWQSGPLAYLNRAWCRMEMLYAATIPLRKESKPGGNRYLKFQGALKIAANQNRRPHILYGSKEYYETKQILTLPPLRNSYFHDFNPAEGIVRYHEDRMKIASLMLELEKYRHHDHTQYNAALHHSNRSLTSTGSSSTVSSTTPYCGPLDNKGRRHGYGVLTFENGDHFEGNFQHGQREGYGILSYANGDQYRGHFHLDKRQGRGVMIYGNGNRYVGSFDRGYRNGNGVLTYADGSIYDGTFVYGYQSGFGLWYQANGDFYEGETQRDHWHGSGKWTRFSTAEIITGRFEKSKPVPGESKSTPLT